jgi:hypothetical protein
MCHTRMNNCSLRDEDQEFLPRKYYCLTRLILAVALVFSGILSRLRAMLLPRAKRNVKVRVTVWFKESAVARD